MREPEELNTVAGVPPPTLNMLLHTQEHHHHGLVKATAVPGVEGAVCRMEALPTPPVPAWLTADTRTM